jgi:hypothetical protein
VGYNQADDSRLLDALRVSVKGGQNMLTDADKVEPKNIHGLVVQILHVDQFRSVYQRNNKRSGVKVISLCM